MTVRFTFMITLMFSGVYGQGVIKGTVTTKTDGSPIPYANIGIRGTAVGSASFETGEFEMKIPEEFIGDSLTFSAIGYKSATKAINQFSATEQNSIKLDEDIRVLSEVVIASSRKVSSVQLGLSGLSTSAVQFSSPEGGAAMALLVNEEGKTMVLEKATVDISKNELSEFKLRCRIMNVENGRPGKDLLGQSVIITSSIKKGLVSVDLNPYNLTVSEPFFIVFEWILDKAMSDYYKNLLNNRPAWWPKGASIHNRKTVVLYDDQNKIIKKIPMTKVQQAEYEKIRMRYTEFSTKPSKHACFARNSSMNNWVEIERDVVCYIIGY